jgi:3' terminal RNA ribose 2'-O-methyltransferase Hen1
VLLTISTTHRPPDELGYLLAKHPDRVHRAALPFGTATVCFPELGADSATAALVVDVDPVRLVRRAAGAGPDGFALGQHVNDRGHAASSLLSVAIARTLRSALAGQCRERPELAGTPIPLRLAVPAVRDADGLAAALFEPLGWRVRAEPRGPVHVALELAGRMPLADALSQVYVLLPVLDDAKHYPVGQDEADKLLHAGGDWLAGHPERELITRRYLRHRRALVSPLLQQLGVAAELAPRDTPLRELRRAAMLRELRSAGARRVLDLGCGDGALLADLAADRTFSEVVGVDASSAALRRAERRLRLDTAAPAVRERVSLRNGALTYRDPALAGYDAAVLMEVVEHLDPDRLPALADAVLGAAAPAIVLVSTPNREYNARYPDLPPGRLRHPDHRFEWSRAEFARWCAGVAGEYGYRVRHEGVGEVDPELGTPTQLAVFTRSRSWEVC